MSNKTLLKIKATADILGGAVFFANENGIDPEYPNNTGLLANGMYIRLVGSDNGVAYISAYEIDKALDIITEMSKDKASVSDLEALEVLINEKASKVDLELLYSEVETKVSKTFIDNLLTSLDDKANQTTVDELTTELNLKANQTTVDELLNDVKTLKNIVGTISDENIINTINQQILYLNGEIVKRLTADDIKPITSNIIKINDDIELLNEKVNIVETNLINKASNTYVQGQVSELNNAITGLAKKVDNKADKSIVSNKANQSDVDSLLRKVTSLNTQVTDFEVSLDNNYKDLNDSLNTKANKTYVDSNINNIIRDLSTKANVTSVNNEFNELNTRISNVETIYSESINNLSEEVDELQCEFNNISSELNSSIIVQNKKIDETQKNINKLQSVTTEQADQLKTSWVRVLSSKEYNNLRPAPEGIPYNSRYKYPNTVYLVVDFNKPKAIYIGDILVAKAEQKGSIGFAYTFPIVF